MNWKKTTKTKMDEEDDSFPQLGPLIINTEQTTSSSLRIFENKIFFYDEVSNESCLDLNKVLLDVDVKLQNTKNILGNCFHPTIELHVKTPGGCLHSAIAVIDFMKTLKSDIHTYVDGCVASAGTMLTLVGKKRFMGQHASLLIHQLSGEMYGKYSEMEDDIENYTNMMKFIKAFYKQYTKIPMKKLDELLKRDLWLNSEECLAYGIVDEII